MKTTFKEKFNSFTNKSRDGIKSFSHKRAVALKRNFYSLPFAFVCLSCFIFLCSLFIFIKSVYRISFNYSSIFLFIATLTSILSVVAIINYTKNVYGQKRPVKMLVVYFVLIAICIACVIVVFYFNEKQVAEEILKRDNLEKQTGTRTAEWYVYQTYINYGCCSRVLFVIFFILEFITNGLLIAGPLFEKKLKSINFDSPLENEQHE